MDLGVRTRSSWSATASDTTGFSLNYLYSCFILMVVGNATSGRSCENTTIFPSVTVALVNDMSRHYMTHSIQMWWGGTSDMMTRARLSYGYSYRSILRRSLASFVVSILRSSNFWGVILECLTLLLGGSHFLQCIRVPVYWG